MKNVHVKSILGVLFVFCMMTQTVWAQFDFFGAAKKDTSGESVEVTADKLEYVRDDDKVIAKGNVVIIHGEDRLVADYAEVYQTRKEAVAEGHVILSQGDLQFQGERVEYNFATHQGTFPDGRMINVPFYGNSKEMEQVSEGKAILYDSFISTCDRKFSPHYGMSAKKVRVYFDDKMIATNCFFEFLGKKIIWWPYFVVPINSKNAPISATPGYSSKWGAYILTSKGFSINKNIKGKIHYDYRAKRGHAWGVDLDYDLKQWGEGFVKTYIISDELAPDIKASDPEGTLIKDDRYRVKWKHRMDIDEYSNIQMEYNNLHDEYFLKDFFEKEYEEEVSPKTYVTYTRNQGNYGFLVDFQKRVNRFSSTLEKTPEVRFNWNNKEIADTNVYYKNETSVSNFTQRYARSDQEDDVVRFDSFHEASYPVRFMRWNFLPYVNMREDYYSKNNTGKENIDRTVFGGGMDVSTRFFRLFDVSGNKWGFEFNQLRHIIEPSISYESIRETTVPENTLFQMDAIDSKDDLDLLTFGVRNKLQTKRMVDGELKRVDLLSVATYAQYEFNREVTGGTKWLNLDTEVELRPYSWLTMYHKNTWDILSDQFTSAEYDLELQPTDRWKFFLSHRFANDSSCLVEFDTEYTINDLWRVGSTLREEFDTHHLEEFELRFMRDLHCWDFEFGINKRAYAGDQRETELFFNLTLKAFPEYYARTGNRASFTRARFGNLVAGSAV